jgi:DNA-binding NarL/FixJ family response regulator
MNKIRVLLVDDHALVRAGIRALLHELGFDVVAEAGDAYEAVQLIEVHKPDVVLMDIAMPGLSGLEVTTQLAQAMPQVRVIILSVHTNAEYVRRALRAGAAGYLIKNSAATELDIAIKAAARGDTYLSPAVAKFITADYVGNGGGGSNTLSRLTPRQIEILQLIARGYTRKQIAEALSISVKTVDSYRAQLMEQLDIRDTAGLVLHAVRAGLVTPEE